MGSETRTFLEDGDTIAISATAPGVGGSRIGFGGCSRSDPACNANRKIVIDNCLIHADLMSGIPCLTILRR